MTSFSRIIFLVFLFISGEYMYAQTFKAERLRKAAEVLGIQCLPDTLEYNQSVEMTTKDGRKISLRTDRQGVVEHIGIPLFSDVMRTLQPSPVYDFLEYAVLNWKYKINPNQLYLSKVIFKKGNWDTLLSQNLQEASCSIENMEDKLYVVTWQQEEKDIACIGVPIEYELLNNDTRRNMERIFLKELSGYKRSVERKAIPVVNEEDLSLYGVEGLFVIPGKSYIMSWLNQNVYYQFTTVCETVDSVINNKPVTLRMESVLPVVVNSEEYPSETLANFMMCEDESVPDVRMEMTVHLSNYHNHKVSMPLSTFREFLKEKGCDMYFACDIERKGIIHGMMFASNLPKGYNHLISLNMDVSQLREEYPLVKADMYLYIPPLEKSKLFGKEPTKKSGAKFKLP